MFVLVFAYAAMGVVCTLASVWLPSISETPSITPDRAWVEERAGLYWLVEQTPRRVGASAYRTRAHATIARDDLVSLGAALVPDDQMPPLPDWCHFRGVTVTPDMVPPPNNPPLPSGWAGAGSAYIRSGWPFAAFTGGQTQYVANTAPPRALLTARRDHMLTLRHGEVPSKPLWPGLLADVLVYALLAAVLHRILLLGAHTATQYLGRRPI
jgi:hypothetical protein